MTLPASGSTGEGSSVGPDDEQARNNHEAANAPPTEPMKRVRAIEHLCAR
jgi:hypothetical protein